MEFGLIKTILKWIFTWTLLCVRIMGTLGYCKLQTILHSLIKYIKTGKELTFRYHHNPNTNPLLTVPLTHIYAQSINNTWHIWYIPLIAAQILCCINYTSPWVGFKLTTLVVIGTDCIGNCKSNYHTITTMTAPWVKDKINSGRVIINKKWVRKLLIIGNKIVSIKCKYNNILFR
jgi:hypothetical protein